MRLSRTLIALTLAALTGFPDATRAQGTIRGVVFDSLLAKAPLAGAHVVIEGAPHSAVTDRFGRYTLRDVPAGPQLLTFYHPTLDSLEMSVPLRPVEVPARGTATLALAIPSVRGLSRQLCDVPPPDATAIVFGLARVAEDGRALPGATVSIRWYEVEINAGVARQVERYASAETAENGRYVLCGVPNDIDLTMRVAIGRQSTGMLHLGLDRDEIARRDARVSLTDSAAWADDAPSDAVAGDSVATIRAPGSARLRVRVRDANGRPVAGAVVGVRGTAASATTGADGSGIIVGAPAGSQTVVARSIGRSPTVRVLALTPQGETSAEFRLSKLPTQLPTVAVTGVRDSPSDAAWEARRKSGFGHFFTEKDLSAVRNSNAIWARIPGVYLSYSSSVGSDPMPTMTAPIPTPGQMRCVPAVWLDGSRQPWIDPWELRLLVLGAKRMEVYTRQVEVPAVYVTPGVLCGAIIIWTQ